MIDFEIVLCCILIPVSIVLAYVAGKNDLLNMFGEMIREKTEEIKMKRELEQQSYHQDTRDLVNKAYEQGYLSGFDFSVMMQRYLISEGGYVIDTGNYENVNAEVALRLSRKIEEHPHLWRIFMVA